jgi:heat shock protein HtpX
MFKNGAKTVVLLAGIGALFMAVGSYFGGSGGLTIGLAIGVLFVGGSYWFSDKLAVRAAGAVPVSEAEAPKLYAIVRDLTARMSIPMPAIYISPAAQPNAFATGRNPDHAAVAVTQGLFQIVDDDELRGVLAHELTHIRNRDILIQSVASAIGAAITYLAYMLLWFGDDDNSPLGLVASLAMVLLAPIAASIIQLAISRQREYAADAGGAEICGNPESLASALLRLEQGATAMPMKVNQAAEPLYIVRPFSAKGLAGLFSTHPPIEERVRRLRQMRPSL